MGNVTHFDKPDAADELRKALQIELDVSGLSMARAASQMGRHASSLSRWLSSTYTGNNEAVAADVARWLETRADAARHSLEGAGLDRHAETAAYKQITTALGYAQATGDIVTVIGKPGRGKTWAVQHYCEAKTGAYYFPASGAITKMPGLLSRIGSTIGAGSSFRSALEAETAVIDHLRGHGDALLVVDEAQHLRDRLLDELRVIRDHAGCDLALVADETIRMAFTRLPQIKGRVGLAIDLKAQPEADVEQIAAGVPKRAPSKAELKMLNAVARGSGGLHALRRLLGGAWMIARGSGRQEIEAADIAAAAAEGVAADEGAAAEQAA